MSEGVKYVVLHEVKCNPYQGFICECCCCCCFGGEERTWRKCVNYHMLILLSVHIKCVLYLIGGKHGVLGGGGHTQVTPPPPSHPDKTLLVGDCRHSKNLVGDCRHGKPCW